MRLPRFKPSFLVEAAEITRVLNDRVIVEGMEGEVVLVVGEGWIRELDPEVGGFVTQLPGDDEYSYCSGEFFEKNHDPFPEGTIHVDLVCQKLDDHSEEARRTFIQHFDKGMLICRAKMVSLALSRDPEEPSDDPGDRVVDLSETCDTLEMGLIQAKNAADSYEDRLRELDEKPKFTPKQIEALGEALKKFLSGVALG